MAFATNKWVEEIGAPMSCEYHLKQLAKQCKAACDLYGYWAWGDCYGIYEIIAPDGEELKEGSVWGFYGPHEESGILDDARSTIEWHKKEVIKEDAESFEMACRDVATV
jgi:hypothetical protein